MVNIPIGLQSYKRQSGLEPEVKLLNMFLEKDDSGAAPDEYFRLQRPGLTHYGDPFPDPIRAVYFVQGVAADLPIIVAGDTVYTTDGATNASYGTIDDDGLSVPIAATFERIGLCSSGLFYSFDGAAITSIEIPDSGYLIDLETINSYFILPLANGTFYWLVPGDTTIDGLNFATAESSPDGLVAVRRLGDELFMFGNSTVEVWQPTGDADAPFQRAAGRLFDKGCLARDTVRAYDNSLVWVGNDGIVYRASNEPLRISTFSIEERLRKRTSDPSAWTFVHDAHLFYVLRIPGQGTFAYDASSHQWSEFGTYGQTVWKPSLGVQTPFGAICGGSDGKIWYLDPDASNDDGAILERIVTGSIAFDGVPVRCNSFTLVAGASEDCTVDLRWYDGRDAPPTTWETLSIRAPVDNASLYRLGAAHQPVRTFEIRATADMKVRYSGARLNEGWE